MRVYLQSKLSENELELFIKFIEKISDKFSLARYFNGVLSSERLAEINQEHINILKEHNLQMKEKFHSDAEYHNRILQMIGSEEEAEEYFNDLYLQDMESAEMIELDDEDKPYFTERSDFIRNEYTRDTHVTSGPLFEVCHFKMQETWKEVKQQLCSLFSFPIVIDGISFEDTTFYKDGQVKCAICAHECFCWMELSNEELEKFDVFGIKYESETLL